MNQNKAHNPNEHGEPEPARVYTRQPSVELAALRQQLEDAQRELEEWRTGKRRIVSVGYFTMTPAGPAYPTTVYTVKE